MGGAHHDVTFGSRMERKKASEVAIPQVPLTNLRSQVQAEQGRAEDIGGRHS